LRQQQNHEQIYKTCFGLSEQVWMDDTISYNFAF